MLLASAINTQIDNKRYKSAETSHPAPTGTRLEVIWFLISEKSEPCARLGGDAGCFFLHNPLWVSGKRWRWELTWETEDDEYAKAEPERSLYPPPKRVTPDGLRITKEAYPI